MRDVRVAGVAVADGEGRARDRDGDAERVAGAADEGGLSAAEIARDGDDVADAQTAREAARDLLGLRGARRVELDAQNRPS